MKKLFLFLAISLPVMFLSSCSDNDEPAFSGPFGTGACSNVDYQTTIAFGYIDATQVKADAFGIAYGQTEDLSNSKMRKLVASNGVKDVDNRYAVTLTGLDFDTKYYYAAYYRADGKYILGEVKSFTTNKMPEYIDMGLPSHTLWATRNVGANAPEEWGHYFQWGDPKGNGSDVNDGRICDWKHLLYYDDEGEIFTKYTGFDGLKELEETDDMATRNWGKDWRMPSKEQFEELIDVSGKGYTEIAKNSDGGYIVEMKGVKGLKIVSKKNKNYLFLPAAGYRVDNHFYDGGSEGLYWSRTHYPLEKNEGFFAWYLNLRSIGVYMDDYYRYAGMTVRPVRR